MAIYVKTSNPKEIISKIKHGIEKGKIDTWKCDSNDYFRHTQNLWDEIIKGNDMFFKPIYSNGKLIFGLTCNKKQQLPRKPYGIYHGRFIEMLINHCSDFIDEISVSIKNVKYIDDYEIDESL